MREPSHCYILTEYCDQGDLSALLKKKRRLPEAEVLRLAKDIIAGFVEMAEKQFLHRDLKLANIFLSGGRAVIADFGFAKKHAYLWVKSGMSSSGRSITWGVRCTCRRKPSSATSTR
jgi:serine/threonine protein kinase